MVPEGAKAAPGTPSMWQARSILATSPAFNCLLGANFCLPDWTSDSCLGRNEKKASQISTRLYTSQICRIMQIAQTLLCGRATIPVSKQPRNARPETCLKKHFQPQKSRVRRAWTRPVQTRGLVYVESGGSEVGVLIEVRGCCRCLVKCQTSRSLCTQSEGECLTMP